MSLNDDELKLNLLVAYPYMKPSTIAALNACQSQTRFVLDSGAFTAWKAGKEVNIDEYCRFIETLPFKPWRYFTLDVIGDPARSMKNYETMLKRGFNPVPIFTRGEHPSVLDDYYKTSDVVGIGGLVGTGGNKGFVNGIMKHVGKRKVHWLGFTSVDYIKFYKPYMCDSSSWVMALTFAQMKLYDKGGKFISLAKKDFMTQPKPEAIRLLKEYDLNPADFAISANWKNSGKGNYPTEKAAFRSFVKFQRDIQINVQTKMFMAVSSDLQVNLSVEAYNFWEGKRK
ncbi:hypothetical protein UFOVP263_13 [uncultured Caudovirales phage]|uniref:Uncharacterized protein n=1 Tax=uncultured Caudovirales phage TaxID=2100421 RepID=A0A6J5LGK7_9CAUD|nr:hypothetical protein UFOVP263_13 [uncultured Caudovirales phage]CAB4242129.1 hypothetical protein UFOVP91_50 [uncultured Caudovirales phage]